MDFELSEDEVALAEGMRRLCAGRFPLERVRAAEGASVTIGPSEWSELAEAGVFSLRVPEDGGRSRPGDRGGGGRVRGARAGARARAGPRHAPGGRCRAGRGRRRRSWWARCCASRSRGAGVGRGRTPRLARRTRCRGRRRPLGRRPRRPRGGAGRALPRSAHPAVVGRAAAARGQGRRDPTRRAVAARRLGPRGCPAGGVGRRHARAGGRLCQRARTVRPAHRVVPGRQAPVCRHAGAVRGGARRGACRGGDDRPTRRGRPRRGPPPAPGCSRSRRPSPMARRASRSTGAWGSRGRSPPTSISCGPACSPTRSTGPTRWPSSWPSATDRDRSRQIETVRALRRGRIVTEGAATTRDGAGTATGAVAPPVQIIPAGEVVFGLQLPIQSQSTIYVEEWELGSGPGRAGPGGAPGRSERVLLRGGVRPHRHPAPTGRGHEHDVVRHDRHAGVVGGDHDADPAHEPRLHRGAATPFAGRQGVLHPRRPVGRQGHHRGRRRACERGVRPVRPALRRARCRARRSDRRHRGGPHRRVPHAARAALARE